MATYPTDPQERFNAVGWYYVLTDAELDCILTGCAGGITAGGGVTSNPFDPPPPTRYDEDGNVIGPTTVYYYDDNTPPVEMYTGRQALNFLAVAPKLTPEQYAAFVAGGVRVTRPPQTATVTNDTRWAKNCTTNVFRNTFWLSKNMPIYNTSTWFSTQNGILREGQVAFCIDTGEFKIGDGTLAWNDLPTEPTRALDADYLSIGYGPTAPKYDGTTEPFSAGGGSRLVLGTDSTAGAGYGNLEANSRNFCTVPVLDFVANKNATIFYKLVKGVETPGLAEWDPPVINFDLDSAPTYIYTDTLEILDVGTYKLFLWAVLDDEWVVIPATTFTVNYTVSTGIMGGQADGFYDSNTKFYLYTNAYKGKIYYSLDGSMPSIEYTGPISLSGSTYIRYFATDIRGNVQNTVTTYTALRWYQHMSFDMFSYDVAGIGWHYTNPGRHDRFKHAWTCPTGNMHFTGTDAPYSGYTQRIDYTYGSGPEVFIPLAAIDLSNWLIQDTNHYIPGWTDRQYPLLYADYP